MEWRLNIILKVKIRQTKIGATESLQIVCGAENSVRKVNLKVFILYFS